MSPLHAAIILSAILWLTGCAETSWNVRATGEPDFKEQSDIIPKFEAGISGRF